MEEKNGAEAPEQVRVAYRRLRVNPMLLRVSIRRNGSKFTVTITERHLRPAEQVCRWVRARGDTAERATENAMKKAIQYHLMGVDPGCEGAYAGWPVVRR
jgi:hypothetical protein